ncbi:TetR family transcriptional regulator [uncultured Amnibacterium sp.]|uniref:TetR family transcriptional regulator n=1 Tax=uncultured Amnibacterium sp. TaxID=1631851 RepID=UPI0035CBCCBC
MTSTTTRAGGLRGIARDAVRARIAEVAVDLFSERGFDAVTIEQIAAGVGISARSFHRYFPAKEDAVLTDPEAWGLLVRDTVAARPADEDVWTSLRLAYEALLEVSDTRDDSRKRVMRVLMSTASLRARNLEKHLLWERLLTPIVAARLGGGDAALRARTVVQASLVCFDTALTAWAEPEEHRSPADLLAVCFSQLE